MREVDKAFYDDPVRLITAESVITCSVDNLRDFNQCDYLRRRFFFVRQCLCYHPFVCVRVPDGLLDEIIVDRYRRGESG
jgi:hypothetical protein